jgi:hypothetical protein
LEWSLDQFRDKSVYQQVLAAFSAEVNEFYLAICNLAQARTVIGGTGVWLDGIGKIVGQPRDPTPVDLPDTFFYWDDSEARRPTGMTDSVHYLDASTQWVTDATVNAGAEPTDADYRDQIIRRVYQNTNKHSSIPELQAAIKEVLGIDVFFEQVGVRKIKVWVPTGTPSWVKYYVTGKSFGYDDAGHTFNRWYFQYPAGVIIDATTGEY